MNTFTLQRLQTRIDARPAAFPDYYAEERWARYRSQARQLRARNALRLVGLLIGVAGVAGALRMWDLGMQP
jgi:hypothetical protein